MTIDDCIKKLSKEFISDIEDNLRDFGFSPEKNFEIADKIVSEISLHFENIKDEYEFWKTHGGKKR